MQAVAAIKHENLERGHVMVDDQMLHLIDVSGLNRRDLIAVIDPEAALRLPEHFGHKIAVRAAAVEVIVTGPDVIEARRDAAHGRGLAFGDGILRQRRVDADMHVGVDATRKRQTILGVEDFLGLARPECPAPAAKSCRP